MKASIDISLYPLTKDYPEIITDFILKLRERQGIKVETNGLSTQIFGDYDILMDILKHDIGQVLSLHKAVFVLKLAADEHTREKLPASLR
jgi:uncharacterized protein YqgV (UPF0045/DUF77 family)